jgi:hypothetical protein
MGCILGYELHPGKKPLLVFRQGRAGGKARVGRFECRNYSG